MAFNVILDVDTGVDDALAILYATRHPDVSVLGITCVDGNTNLAQVCHNTLQVLDAAGAAPIPVAAGAATPLMGPVGDSSHVHGDDGLAGLAHHNTQRQLDPRHAIELIRVLVEESREPVTLVPIGPLTNIALFLSTFPATAAKVQQIVLMGGSASGGNVTATAEFNVWHDPEAAHIVFSSAIPLTMYGLDVFNDLTMGASEVAELREAGTPASILGADITDYRLNSPDGEMTLGDYGAIATLVHPELATGIPMLVSVDTSSGPGRGQTICDQRPSSGDPSDIRLGRECTVIVDVDAESMVRLWIDRMK
jgi:pyrimidine-specific ribonucleoside hydrolase